VSKLAAGGAVLIEFTVGRTEALERCSRATGNEPQ